MGRPRKHRKHLGPSRIWDVTGGYDSPTDERITRVEQNVAFASALIREVKAGTEKAPFGVSKRHSGKPATSFFASGNRSAIGSPASVCLDEG